MQLVQSILARDREPAAAGAAEALPGDNKRKRRQLNRPCLEPMGSSLLVMAAPSGIGRPVLLQQRLGILRRHYFLDMMLPVA
jgi:hypothetical protein